MPYCKYTVESLDFMGAQFSWDPPPPSPIQWIQTTTKYTIHLMFQCRETTSQRNCQISIISKNQPLKISIIPLYSF